jgi:hypothetical protein
VPFAWVVALIPPLETVAPDKGVTEVSVTVPVIVPVVGPEFWVIVMEVVVPLLTVAVAVPVPLVIV